MWGKLTLYFALFCLSISGYGQTDFRDSLKAKLAVEENDKDYINGLLLTETSAINQAILYNHLGLCFQYEYVLDSALHCHQMALEKAKLHSEDNQEIGVSYNKIGIVHYYYGALDTAVIYFEKSISYFKTLDLKANAYNNLALMNKYREKPDVSIENYLEALDIYKSINDQEKEITVLINIGALYISLEEDSLAQNYINKGLDLAVETKDKQQEIEAKLSLANLNFNRGEYALNLPIHEEAIAYFESVNNVKSVILSQNNLANNYSKLGEDDKALKLYLAALKLMSETGGETNKEAVLLNIGSVYESKQDFMSAKDYYYRALSFAQTNELTLRYETIYEHLSSVYHQLNDIDSSLYFKNRQLALRDSLDRIDREKKMLELEAIHGNKTLNSNLESTKHYLSESEREKSIFLKGLVVAVVIIIIVSLIVIVIYKRHQRIKTISEELTISNQQKTENIVHLSQTIDSKNKELENLNHQKETGKLPYPSHLTPLTAREREVLLGVQKGLKDQEIADELFISIATVRTHLRKAYVKIDARNRAEAIQFISTYEMGDLG